MHEAPFLEFLLIHKDWLTRSYDSTVVEHSQLSITKLRNTNNYTERVTHKKYKKVFRNVNCSLPVSEWLPSDNIQYAPKQYTAHPNYKSNVFDLYLPTNSPDRKVFDRNVHLFQLKFATENCAWITSVTSITSLFRDMILVDKVYDEVK